jgi:hypothetical protein
MRTQAQIDASRTNGAKSRGPTTPEGKVRSTGNAIRHGFLRDTVVLLGESEERFLEHMDSFIADFKPASELELSLVEKMAVCRWRQLSVWGLETAGISEAVRQLHENDPLTMDLKTPAVRAFIAIGDLASKNRTLDLCHRYDARFDRQYNRALKHLLDIRREKTPKLPFDPNM